MASQSQASDDPHPTGLPPGGASATDNVQVRTLESDTATITFTGALQGDSDSEESSEPENGNETFAKSGTNDTHTLEQPIEAPKTPDKDIIPPDYFSNVDATASTGKQEQIPKEAAESEAAGQTQAKVERSPVRFNPFDRDDYREDIRNVFPQLRNTSTTTPVAPAQTDVLATRRREELLTSVSSDGCMDAMDSLPTSPTSPTLSGPELGLEEDYFAQPEGLDYTSIEDLQLAIEEYKQKVLESEEHSATRRELVQKLVELRLRLAEAKEEPQEEDPDSKHVVGHHFQKKEGSSGRRYCEKCNGVLWGMLQNWYRCQGCGFCSHTKCLNLITRKCARVKIAEHPYYITSICPERGLASQNYRCLECRAPISYQNVYGEPRHCDYTGAYYCELCHWNDAMVIPARVLHNWDFEPRKVCRASKQVLRLMNLRSVLRIQDLNPMLFNFVEELNEVKKLREEILIMKKYFMSCKAALDSKLLLQLQDRQHFVENSDMYSMFDLDDVVTDVLLPQLAKIHMSFAQHIKTDCQLCKGKGYICELCDYEEVLFPFDNHAIVCSQCFTVLHRHCYMRRQQRCPKCERIEKRGVQDLSELVDLTVTLQT